MEATDLFLCSARSVHVTRRNAEAQSELEVKNNTLDAADEA